jgi:hypothetical protein
MLGETLAAALPGLRAEAESRMSETVRIGVLVEDEDLDTLEVTNILDPVVYEGKARIRFPQNPSAEVDAAGQLIVKQDGVLSLPAETAGVVPDMRVVFDASTADPSLVGRVLRVKGFAVSGQTTATRFTVEETGEQIEEES